MVVIAGLATYIGYWQQRRKHMKLLNEPEPSLNELAEQRSSNPANFVEVPLADEGGEKTGSEDRQNSSSSQNDLCLPPPASQRRSRDASAALGSQLSLTNQNAKPQYVCMETMGSSV